MNLTKLPANRPVVRFSAIAATQTVRRTMVRLVLLMTMAVATTACGLSAKQDNTTEPTLVPTPQLATRYLAEGEIAKAANVYAQLAKSETDTNKRNEYLPVSYTHLTLPTICSV